MSDSTAMGVAKLRYTEMLCDASTRLFDDPFAHHFVPGSSVMWLMGYNLNLWLNNKLLGAGFYEMMTARTRIIDDFVTERANEAAQLVILGAGYDMRAHRLGLPPAMRVYEVDQREVQAKKRAKLQHAVPAAALRAVHYVTVDFNGESVGAALRGAADFDPSARTLVLLEGVSMYISRAALRDTLRQVDAVTGAGSSLLFTYIDENITAAPAKVCGEGYAKPDFSMLLSLAEKVGEPWVSLYGQTALRAEVLGGGSGFRLGADLSMLEANERYFAPAGRALPASQMCFFERTSSRIAATGVAAPTS
eukprot:Selendium_serpulae@DN2375_c1_g1_i1.p1